jgi:monoamine oxidase
LPPTHEKETNVSAQQTFVIVGAGLAGAKAAEALRTNGFDARMTARPCPQDS